MEDKTKNTVLFSFFTILVIVLISCTQNSTQLAVIRYFINDEIRQITDAILVQKKKNGRKIYTYYDTVVSDSTEIMEVIQDEEKNYIEFNKVKCAKLGDDEYTVKGNRYVVNKYFFDEERVQDEELILFFDEMYGVLVEYSEQWLTLKTYEIDSISAALVNKILKDNVESLKIKLPEPTGEIN